MSRPNLLFIITDQQRWDFIGYESGNGTTHTPRLDALAQRGTVFHNAYCPSPLCGPSRAAIHSGQRCMTSGCHTNIQELPPDTDSFVKQLRAGGYHTAAVGKTHMEIHAYDSDLTSYRHREFMDALGYDEAWEVSGNSLLRTGIEDYYTKFLKERGKFEDVLDFFSYWEKEFRPPDFNGVREWHLDCELHECEFIGDRALQWLEDRDRSKPFYLHLGFSGPHTPIQPEPAFMDWYRDNEETEPWGAEKRPNYKAWRRGYRAMISQIDAKIGQVLDLLKSQGELDNTYIIFTSDHGEMAGDHGHYSKTSFYEASAHVPMIVAGPGLREGYETDELAEIIDSGITFCDLAGVEPHPRDQGTSMAPFLRGETDRLHETVFCEYMCDRMVRDKRYKLSYGEPRDDDRRDLWTRFHSDRPSNIPPAPPHLYDLQVDPRELNNLAENPDYQAVMVDMLGKLINQINANTIIRPYLDRGPYKTLFRKPQSNA